MKILVSACLLGYPCRYDGKSKPCAAAQALSEICEIVPVCPEQAGGLPIPRPPAEIRGDRVLNAEGEDVTEQFRIGAHKTLQTALAHGCQTALLKEKSPSCGYGLIHNGRFDGGLLEGNGICAELLAEHGIAIFGESRIDALRELLQKEKA